MRQLPVWLLTWFNCAVLLAGSAATEIKLTASDGEAYDYFGNSVSVDGDTAVVGAHWNDSAALSAGAVYVFARSAGNWTQQAKLLASDASAGDEFGWSVSVNGDSVVVGARSSSDAGDLSGSAYVFARSGGIWSEQGKLTPSDAAADDSFGWSTSIHGDTVVVGAAQTGLPGTAPGAAYVFVRTGGIWTQQAKLSASDTAAGDRFGGSVSVSGDTAVVGAPFDDDAGDSSGSAYVFLRVGGVWTQQAKLTASDAAGSDKFGSSVFVDSDTVIVGAFRDDDGGTDSGSAYVFTRTGGAWTQQGKLTASDAASGDFFGTSVSVNADVAVVGASDDGDGGALSGSAYVFIRSGAMWSQQGKLTASDAAVSDFFGSAVAVQGDTAVVGAPFSDVDADNIDVGSAYVYSGSPVPVELQTLLVQ